MRNTHEVSYTVGSTHEDSNVQNVNVPSVKLGNVVEGETLIASKSEEGDTDVVSPRYEHNETDNDERPCSISILSRNQG